MALEKKSFEIIKKEFGLVEKEVLEIMKENARRKFEMEEKSCW
jgi:hypothetical protein